MISTLLAINESGQIAFKAYLYREGEGFEASEALLRYTPGVGSEVLAYEGQDYCESGPCQPIYEIDWEDQLPFNDAGHLVAVFELDNLDEDWDQRTAVVLIRGPGDWEEIARVGGLAVGGGRYQTVTNPVINNAGTIVYQAEECAPGSDTDTSDGISCGNPESTAGIDRIVQWTPTGQSVIAKGHDALAGDGWFQGFAGYHWQLLDNGNLYFKAGIGGLAPPDTDTNDTVVPSEYDAEGLFVWDGSLTEIDRTIVEEGISFWTAIDDGTFFYRIGNESEDAELWCWTEADGKRKILAPDDFLDSKTVDNVHMTPMSFQHQTTEGGEIVLGVTLDGQRRQAVLTCPPVVR